MAFFIDSATSSPAIDQRNARIGFSAVMPGTLLAIAGQAVLLLVGAAVAASAALEGFALAAHRGQIWALAIGASACFGLFLGARFAAVNARAVVRRDGFLAGLFTWALFVLVAAIALAIGIAVKRPAWPTLPVMSALLWNGVFILFGSLLFALFGGARGARAEARAIGLRRVRRPAFTRYRDATDLEAYERGFFADPPDPPSAGASLSAS